MCCLLLSTINFSCRKRFFTGEEGVTYPRSALAPANMGMVGTNDSAFNIVAFAGTGTAGSYAGTSGNPQTAQFNVPEGIAFDSNGNMFVADRNNHVIRKISTSGVVTVFAGTVGVAGNTNGAGIAAKFDYPIRLAIDGANNIYVADRNNARIRKITPAAVVTTIAGSTAGSDATQFKWPLDVAVTSDGSKIYVADAKNNRIQQISNSGGVYTTSLLAGQITAGFAGGNGAEAKFNNPSGVAIDPNGNVLVADRGNNCIRKITVAKNVYRFAGVAGVPGDIDAPNGVATFDEPFGITIANDGCVYVADIGNHNIRRVSSNGLFVHTVAGNSKIAGNTIGNYSRFNLPTDVAIDNSDNFYVVDCNNHNIRKLVPQTRVLQITHGWTQSTPHPGVTWYKYKGNGFYLPSEGNNKTQSIDVLDIDLSVNQLVFKLTPDNARATVTDMVGAPTSAVAAISGTFSTQKAVSEESFLHASYLRINDTTRWFANAWDNTSGYWSYHSGIFYINWYYRHRAE
jgi:DNA-binding beta-propeller fold protein YncE